MNGVIIPVNNNPTEFKTDGLTPTNCTIEDGGYCIQGNLVFVYIRLKATTNTAFNITGFPKAKSKLNVGGWPPRMAFTDDTPAFFQARANDVYLFSYGTVTQGTEYGVSTVYLLDR